MNGNMENRRKVLILGAKGMLGQELARVYREDDGYDVVAWDVEDIDVTDFESAEGKIRDFAPALVVNAVAYNAVDACEEDEAEYAKALLLNAEAPGFLARLAKDMDATLIHYSTDYVFDGNLEENKTKTGCHGGGCCGTGASSPGYDETSVPNPVSRYGESKLRGERAVRSVGGTFYVIRLSKLFGRPAMSAIGKKSFFGKMLEAAREKSEVTVVNDEKSCFTYAPDLALASKVLEQSALPSGIYHIVNEDAATWYEAAQELFRLAGMDMTVKPISSDTFPRPARRPRCSALRNTRFLPLRPYTEALEEFLGTVAQARRDNS